MQSVTFVTEPLLHPDFVQYRVVAPLLAQLRGRWEPTLAAPYLSPAVRTDLEDHGIRPLSGGAKFPPLRNSRDEIPSYVWSWGRDAALAWNRKCLSRVLNNDSSVRVNFSMTSAFDADCWYVQSRPLKPALEALRTGVDWPLRVALGLATPVVYRLDWRHIKTTAGLAGRVFASSNHVAHWFRWRGIEVGGVLPIYYSPEFRPSTTSPRRDYILCYLGKETDTVALLKLLETGLPVRLFGAKSASWVSGVFRRREFPNARVLGRVSTEELRDLYTHALLTAFPFTEESFGLVPVESMACGTPVLTYATQGPGESVADGRTGWLVRTADEFAALAVEVFRNGYASATVNACLSRAHRFDLETARSNWNDLLSWLTVDRSRKKPTPRYGIPAEAPEFPAAPTPLLPSEGR